ncbi:MAG: pentapeptide repeat-containing protein [Phycisphaeraceae bacterium]|nr:pentapeptide repeat-containing protein [Phycisphaeraceae bacterium]QYK49169.1 MAG: pentapeptide repeat-containing protein [Phycisphaeraceae bacterium]
MDDKKPEPSVLEHSATVERQDSLAAVRADIDQMRAQLIEQEHRTPYVALNAYRYFGKKSAKGDAAMKALFWRVFAPYTAAMVFAGGGGIIAGVTAYIAYQQVQRLSQQNELIELQAQLAAIARQADLEQQSAARAYDEITRILDQNASAGAIVDALDRLPEAMVMPVTIVDPSWSPTTSADGRARFRTIPDTKTVYPNLVPLAQRLLTFAKSDRPAKDTYWSDQEIGSVSTGIALALHRVGFGNAVRIPKDGCVWHCIFNEKGLPQNDADEKVHAFRGSRISKSVLAERAGSDRYAQVRVVEGNSTADLRHLRHEQLVGVQLPMLALSKVKLCNVNMSGANLQKAVLRQGCFRGSVLYGAELQGAILNDARLDGAHLSNAQLQGAFLSAYLRGANLVDAQLQGADLMNAHLQGANLRKAQLQGASLSSADLRGADFTSAGLSGATLEFVIDPTTGVPHRELPAFLRYHFGSRAQSPLAISLDVPPAILHEAKFYSIVIVQSPKRPDEVEQWAWWPTHEGAVADLRQRLGDRAEEMIATLVERQTTFTCALVDGVILDLDSLISLYSANATVPPLDQAFATANTNVAAVAERTMNPYRFPSWGDLLALAQHQASERANPKPSE